MSVSVKAIWSGGKSPLSTFQTMKALTAWSDEVGPKLRSAVKDETPERSGRMKRSERYERKTSKGSVSMRVTAHVPYAPYVIKGARPHLIRPVAARALHWVGPQGGVFAKVVHHPGNKPNDFPRRVLQALRQDITDNLKDKLQRELRG